MTMPSPIPRPDAPAAPAERLARLGPAAAALCTFALHAACGGRYGLFRDELYFLVCGERLSAGYVDQPPGIAVVARLAHALFGTWVPGLRLFAWLATAATVYLAGRLAARLLNGSGAAATLAAVATFACLQLRALGHILTMNVFEPLLLVALVHVLVRLAEGEDRRLWVAAGGLAGLAVLFKYSAAPVVIFLLLGLAVTSGRRALWTRWALVGAIFGALVVLPNLLWQASHGFPFLELVRNGISRKNVAMSPGQLWGNVLFEANPGNAPLLVGGLAWLLAATRARTARFVGVAMALQLLALTFGHAKPYYASAILPILLAAGGAAVVGILRGRWARVVPAVCGASLVASALVFAPMAVPLLPEPAFVAYQRALGMAPAATEKLAQGALPQVFADMHGWDELVEGVARVWRSLPPDDQRRAVVVAKNYGVASAIELLGPAHGLPRGIAVSGHNQYWFWGLPPGRGDPAVFVGQPFEECGGFYEQWTVAAQLPRTPYVMPYEDAHTLWLCRGALGPLTGLPPELRHFE